MKLVKDLLKHQNQKDLFEEHKFISQEFQDFGYRLALKLDDLTHKTLYMKLAKQEPRALLEQALSFAIDYPRAKNRARLFMWKLNELKHPKDEGDEGKDSGYKGNSGNTPSA